MVDIESFIHTIKTYNKNSRGVDSWTCTELKQMPKCVLSMFLNVINLTYQNAANPHQSLISLNPLLGKPSGGTRTICLTPMLYRQTCRTQAFQIKHWEKEHVEDFDMARPGSSALNAALVRNVLAGVAMHEGLNTIAVFNDLMHFFDTVDIPHLVENLKSKNILNI